MYWLFFTYLTEGRPNEYHNNIMHLLFEVQTTIHKIFALTKYIFFRPVIFLEEESNSCLTKAQ